MLDWYKLMNLVNNKELESYVQEKFKERTITLRYTP